MKRSLLLILIVAIYAATGALFWVAGLKTVTLYPTKDSYSWESVPLANNGYSDNFEITSYNKPPFNMRGWIDFNTSSIPSNVWLISAQLRLRLWTKSPNDPTQNMADSTGRMYGVYRLIQPWAENRINWVNQPNYTDEYHATSPVPPGEGGWNGPLLWMNWDITGIMRDWLSGVNNDGLVVRDMQENSSTFYTTQFFTHDQVPNRSYYPRLVITYILPQDIAMFAMALLVETAFILAWRRRQSGRSRAR